MIPRQFSVTFPGQFGVTMLPRQFGVTMLPGQFGVTVFPKQFSVTMFPTLFSAHCFAGTVFSVSWKNGRFHMNFA